MTERDVSTVTGGYELGSAARASGEHSSRRTRRSRPRGAPATRQERDFFQGLVHVVVSAYQSGRGKPVAAERQRVKAMRATHALCAASPRARRGAAARAARACRGRSA